MAEIQGLLNRLIFHTSGKEIESFEGLNFNDFSLEMKLAVLKKYSVGEVLSEEEKEMLIRWEAYKDAWMFRSDK